MDYSSKDDFYNILRHTLGNKVACLKDFFDQISWQIHFLNINFKPEVLELKCFRVYF